VLISPGPPSVNEDVVVLVVIVPGVNTLPVFWIPVGATDVM
jgi:hypothetical protein